MPEALLDRQVLFYGGKGGVGKTTMATAFALLAAERGYRTLLVSTDPAHSTADVLDKELGPEPTAVTRDLWAVEIDPSREADRYIADVKARIADVTAPRLAAEVDRQIDIARLTPGAEEAAVFDRFTHLIDAIGDPYQRVIFDTAPLGSTLRLLALPEHLSLWISGLIGRRKKVNTLGKMWRRVAGAAAGDERSPDDPVLAALEERKARFERARKVITDRRQAGFVFVVTPERLPVLETQRAVDTLSRHGIPIAGIIANRVRSSVPGGGAPHQRALVDELTAAFAGHPLYRAPEVEEELQGVGPLRRLAGMVTFGA
jgi:arsenite-transporting ATPase